jgi:hypothetical protein
MDPSNKHEQIIARAVDEKCLEDGGDRYHLIVRDVAMLVDFLMSASDTQFLVEYVRWRNAQPAPDVPVRSGAFCR